MLGFFLPQILLGAAQRRQCRTGQLILTYHYLGTPPGRTGDPFLFVAADRFEEQLASLLSAGVKPGTLDDPCRPETAVITFDDGAAHVPAIALGPLARHGFRAIQFITAGLLGGTNQWDAKDGRTPLPLMDASAIRDWISAGHDIGSHTLTHPDLSKCPDAEARRQIFDSKKLLEDIAGREVRHFCYPHGRWTPQVRALVAEAGYATACVTKTGINPPGADLFLLRRNAPLSTGELLAKARHRLMRKLRGAFR